MLLQDDSPSDEEDESSDNDSVSSADNQIEVPLIASDVKMYTECLMDLGPLIECPATDSKKGKEPRTSMIRERLAHEYHVELILAKYPEADTQLAYCLGKTSWDRYQRMKEERETNILYSAAKSQADGSEFVDSGLGTSIPDGASFYAESTVSFMTGVTEGKRVQIPSLSAEAKRGEKFECHACGKHIRVKSSRDWR